MLQMKLKIALIIIVSTVLSQELLIQTNSGVIQGYYDEISGVKAFLGIPYAKPPIGDLRWKRPQPVEGWSQTRAALSYSAACWQHNDSAELVNQSEDCLYLNIWAPKENTQNMPVMVFIHGGSFVDGSGNMKIHKGNLLSQKGNVVIVTINYRLGIFGFMTHDLLSSEDPAYPTSGNYGLLDQNLALKWVKNNIAQFGGDANNITLFGESAGSFSICYHLLMGQSANLFNRVILQSGSCYYPNRPIGQPVLIKDNPSAHMPSWKKASQVWLKENNCSSISCARNLTGKAISDYSKRIKLNTVWPVIDGIVIKDDPVNLFDSGDYNKVDVLHGGNKDEGTMFSTNYVSLSKSNYQQLIKSSFGNYSGEALDVYNVDKFDAPWRAVSAIIGDYTFICPITALSKILFSNSGKNTYEYHFTQIPEYLTKDAIDFLRSFHAAELYYIFGNPDTTFAPLTADETKFSNQLIGLWTSFARNGKPEITTTPSVVWPLYNSNHSYLQLQSNNFTSMNDLGGRRCELYEKVSSSANGIKLFYLGFIIVLSMIFI
jgi:para-nitrobenzyl esterase